MKRTRRKRQWRGSLPTSGEMIGALAYILDWKPQQSVGERTWRKFTHGEPIHDDTRGAILTEVVDRLIQTLARYVPVPEEERPAVEQLKVFVEDIVRAHVAWWDGLCARLNEALPANPTELTQSVVFRLVVVELALRFSGMLAIGNNWAWAHEPPPTRENVRIEERLLPQVLRELLKACGITRQSLADELGVSKEAVDQWLAADAVIRPETLDDIAEVAAERKQGLNGEALQIGLRVWRVWTRVLLAIRDKVGQEELAQLFVALRRLSGRALKVLAQELEGLKDEERRERLWLLVWAGSESPTAMRQRGALLEQEEDESWRGVISSPPQRWVKFLARTLAQERHEAKFREVAQTEGFHFIRRNPLSSRNLVLFQPERLPPLINTLETLPPDEVDVGLAVTLQHALQELAGAEASLKLCEMLGQIAEQARFRLRTSPPEMRPAWNWLIWGGYAMCLAKFCEMGQLLVERRDEAGLVEWSPRFVAALNAIPPLPEEVDPSLAVFIDALRRLKDAQRKLEAQEAP